MMRVITYLMMTTGLSGCSTGNLMPPYDSIVSPASMPYCFMACRIVVTQENIRDNPKLTSVSKRGDTELRENISLGDR